MKNNKNIVFLFSGQGSHYRGMGRELFNNNVVFRDSLTEFDRFIYRQINRSIINEIYNKDEPNFKDLLITHPAILAIQLSMWRVLQGLGIHPTYTGGNSLGELAALVACGAIDAYSALEISIEQAKIILKKDIYGEMLVVINHPIENLEAYYHKCNLFLASDNFNNNYTLSGDTQSIKAFEHELQRKKIQYLLLPIEHPFHSPLLNPIEKEFLWILSQYQINKPQKGFISGIEYKEMSHISTDYLWQVTSRYSNFTKFVNYIEQFSPCLYIDIGPSGSMATFVKYNLATSTDSSTFQIMTPFHKEIQQLELLKSLLL